MLIRQFGLRVRQLRQARRLTREDLAELTDLSPQHIAKIESGNRFVTAISLERLALGLNVEVCKLFKFGAPDRIVAASALKEITHLLRGQSERMLSLVSDVILRLLKG